MDDRRRDGHRPGCLVSPQGGIVSRLYCDVYYVMACTTECRDSLDMFHNNERRSNGMLRIV